MNWYDTIKIAKLKVDVLRSNSYGELTILINGKEYNYRLPYSAREIGDDIKRWNAKNNGKKLNQIIRWLDQFWEQ